MYCKSALCLLLRVSVDILSTLTLEYGIQYIKLHVRVEVCVGCACAEPLGLRERRELGGRALQGGGEDAATLHTDVALHQVGEGEEVEDKGGCLCVGCVCVGVCLWEGCLCVTVLLGVMCPFDSTLV